LATKHSTTTRHHVHHTAVVVMFCGGWHCVKFQV